MNSKPVQQHITSDVQAECNRLLWMTAALERRGWAGKISGRLLSECSHIPYQRAYKRLKILQRDGKLRLERAEDGWPPTWHFNDNGAWYLESVDRWANAWGLPYWTDFTELSDRDCRVWLAVAALKHQRLDTNYRRIQDMAGLSAHSLVHTALVRLRQKGYLEFDDGRVNAINLVVWPVMDLIQAEIRSNGLE